MEHQNLTDFILQTKIVSGREGFLQGELVRLLQGEIAADGKVAVAGFDLEVGHRRIDHDKRCHPRGGILWLDAFAGERLVESH